MPKLVITNFGLPYLLARKLNGNSENWTLRLFRNDYTPVATSAAGNFLEADFPGYNSRDLLSALWQPPTLSSGRAISLYSTSPLSWTMGIGTNQTVYGYYVQPYLLTDVIFAQRFDASRTLASGAILYLQPQFTEATDLLP